MAIKKSKFDILIVGTGLSGAVLAERFANHSNLKVLVSKSVTMLAVTVMIILMKMES